MQLKFVKNTFLLIFILFCFIIIYSFSTYAQEDSSLVISELMPNPAGADDTGEWLEIFNTSSSSQNLKDWRLESSILPDITIAPQEILIIARNPTFLKNLYPELSAKIVPASFVLLNSGDSIELINTATNENMVFVYSQAEEGKSFELLKGDCQAIQKNPLGNSIGKENTSCAILLTPTVTLSPLPTNVRVTETPDPTVKNTGIAINEKLQTSQQINTNENTNEKIRKQIKLKVPKIYRL